MAQICLIEIRWRGVACLTMPISVNSRKWRLTVYWLRSQESTVILLVLLAHVQPHRPGLCQNCSAIRNLFWPVYWKL